MRYGMPVILFIIGLLSILGQVVLLRELNVAFYGVELIYLLALGVWLFLSALGALAAHRRLRPSPNGLTVLFLLFGVSVVLSVVFIRASRTVFAAVPGAYLSFPEQLLAMALALLPVGVLSGLLFQWAARMYIARHKTLIAAYGIESMGGLAGGLLATTCLKWGIQNFSTAVLCGAAAVLVAAVYFSGRRSLLFSVPALGLAGFMLSMLWPPLTPDLLMTAWNHRGLVESRDSPYGRVTVTKLDGQVSVFENDAIAFETQGTEAETFANLAALQHPGPESVLILGGGVEGTVKEILKQSPKRVDYVELNPVMVEAVLPHLPADIRRSFEQPGVRLIVDDPRKFLRGSGRYDLILIGMPEPSSGQSNRFFTREFFSLCAERLNPLGVVGLRLRSAENFWTPQLRRRTASIYHALASVFPSVLVLPGATDIITASRSPLPTAPEVMVERLEQRKVEARLVSAPYICYLFTNDRFAEVNGTLRASSVQPNTDSRPVGYQYALMTWLAKFFPQLALPDPVEYVEFYVAKGMGYWAGAVVLTIFLLARLRPSWRNAMLVFTAGFLGMVLETVLILHYQVKSGVLYQDIGILLTLFMAGLALGSALFDRGVFRRDRRRRSALWIGAGMMALFGLYCLLIMVQVKADNLAGLTTTAGLLGGLGVLVAGVFGYASLHDRQDQDRVVSPLYAADLIGGCLGSILASLVMIPLLGLDVTLQGMTMLALFSIVLV